MTSQNRNRGTLIAMSLFFALLAQGCGDLHNTATVIEVDAVNTFVAKHEDTIIVDVRKPAEYEESHIPDSINVSMQDESFEEALASLDPNRNYIVYCTANHYVGRSNSAMKTMRDLGFNQLHSLEGGHDAWQDAKLPLVESTD